MRIRIPLGFLAVVGVVTLASCHHESSPAAPGTTGQVSKSQDAAAAPSHWVQNQQVKTAMDEIGRLHGSLPTDLPEDVESPTGRMVVVAAASTASAADSLAATAAGLPRALDGKSLGEADRRGFLALADTLHDQAIRLRGESEKIHIEQMQRTMDSITATCISCHSRYRDLAGEMDLTKTLLAPHNPAGPTDKHTP